MKRAIIEGLLFGILTLVGMSLIHKQLVDRSYTHMIKDLINSIHSIITKTHRQRICFVTACEQPRDSMLH